MLSFFVLGIQNLIFLQVHIWSVLTGVSETVLRAHTNPVTAAVSTSSLLCSIRVIIVSLSGYSNLLLGALHHNDDFSHRTNPNLLFQAWHPGGSSVLSVDKSKSAVVWV